MIENMLNTFYNASDYHQCIEDVLASIGHQFGLSRGYIFEENPDKKSVTNTFEWCAKGIESNQKVFINYSYDDFGGREHYIEMFNDTAVLYARMLICCRNITASFWQVPISGPCSSVLFMTAEILKALWGLMTVCTPVFGHRSRLRFFPWQESFCPYTY